MIVATPAQEFALPLRTVVPLENVTPELPLTLRLPVKVMVSPLTPLIVNAPPPMLPLIPLLSVIEPPLLRISAAPLQVTVPLHVPFPVI